MSVGPARPRGDGEAGRARLRRRGRGAGGGHHAPSAVDPKDVIAVFNRLRRANSAVRDRRFDEALPLLDEVLRRRPAERLRAARSWAARTWAWASYAEAIDLVPSLPGAGAHERLRPPVDRHLPRCSAATRDDALREADAALAIDPRFTDARVLRGGVLAARGDYEAAITELQAAVDDRPRQADAPARPGQGPGRGGPQAPKRRPSTRRRCAPSPTSRPPSWASACCRPAAAIERGRAGHAHARAWSWTHAPARPASTWARSSSAGARPPRRPSTAAWPTRRRPRPPSARPPASGSPAADQPPGTERLPRAKRNRAGPERGPPVRSGGRRSRPPVYARKPRSGTHSELGLTLAVRTTCVGVPKLDDV